MNVDFLGRGQSPFFYVLQSFKILCKIIVMEEPILQLNEFEEAAGAILDLAKDQAARDIEQAKLKAQELLEKEKQSFSAMEKEYLENLEDIIKKEKTKISLKTKKELECIESMSEKKIKQAVDYVLEKIMPAGA